MLRADEFDETGGDILHQLKVRLITPEECRKTPGFPRDSQGRR